MRILFCSTFDLVRGLGAGKVVVEVAEALGRLGCDCTLAGPAEIAGGSGVGAEEMAAALGRYVERRAGEFDVVDYTHEYLPFPRDRFPRHTLMVARSVLLVHHLLSIRIPPPAGAVRRLRHAAGSLRRRRWLRRWVEGANTSVRGADLVNVSNPHDRDELLRQGVAAERIVVLPFGLSSDARRRFAAVAARGDRPPVVAFVGTFDYRKGAAEFPEIVRRVCREIPTARFRLLGTRGLFPTREAVLRHFPADLLGRIEVHPSFDPDDLPRLLSDCAAGVFPSHMEGFGFGVLEMLAAGLPVVAYDAPGPPMMLPPEYLVRPGDAAGMAAKVCQLLADPDRLATARAWAARRAADFCWDRIARETAERYELELHNLRDR